MKTKSSYFKFLLFAFVLTFAISCKTDDPITDGVSGTVTDIDGNVYKTLSIGTQTWMIENLRTTKYVNSEPINEIYKGDTTIIIKVRDSLTWDNINVKYDNYSVRVTSKKDKAINAYFTIDSIYISTKCDDNLIVKVGDTLKVKYNSVLKLKRKNYTINVNNNSVWSTLSNGAQCTYNLTTNTDSILKFGRLYNFYSVSDIRNIAPKGWHVPTNVELATLQTYVNAHLGESGNTAKALAAKIDWTTSTTTGAIGNDLSKNNVSGFTALPGGYRGLNGSFVGLGLNGQWWSITSGPYVGGSWYMGMLNFFDNTTNSTYNTQYGLSVRCIKD